MSLIRLTKEFRFEMAHALKDYDGPCKNIHGHSYVLQVTIKGVPISEENHPKLGMVMDFGDLKSIVNAQIVDVYDHALVLFRESVNESAIGFLSSYEKVIYSDYQPTSENMVIDFANKIKQELPKEIELYSVRLMETSTSYAEWFALDNQ